MGGKHGVQAGMPRPEAVSGAQQGIVKDEKEQTSLRIKGGLSKLSMSAAKALVVNEIPTTEAVNCTGSSYFWAPRQMRLHPSHDHGCRRSFRPMAHLPDVNPLTPGYRFTGISARKA